MPTIPALPTEATSLPSDLIAPIPARPTRLIPGYWVWWSLGGVLNGGQHVVAEEAMVALVRVKLEEGCFVEVMRVHRRAYADER